MCLICATASVGRPTPRAREGSPFPEAAAPFPWRDGAPAGLTVTWTGVAGFLFEARGVRIAFDPFVSRPTLLSTMLRRARPDEAAVARWFSGLEAVFAGHAHYDHAMDLPAVARVSPRARIHGGRTVVEACRRAGVPEGRLAAVVGGTTVEAGPFRVSAVASRHGVVPFVRLIDREGLPSEGLPRTAMRWPRGEVLAWRVEVGGRSFHLQGSAGIDDEALAAQPPCDALVACLAARAGTPRYLERLGERLRPSVLVPCHHDDFFAPLDARPRPIATLRWARFVEEAEALGAAHGTRLFLPPRGIPFPA